MGKGEQEQTGFMGSKWMTIILIAVLVILAAILIWILKDPRGFDRFRKKKKPDEALKPTLGQLIHDSNEMYTLEDVDERLKVIAQLSWQRSESSINT
jgi:hypothetical protein